MILIAPSARALQTLINVCDLYAKKHDIVYNTEKTKCMIFWPKVDLSGTAKFKLQGETLSIVDEFKYRY